MDSIEYLTEDSIRLIPSAFNKGGYHAFSGQLSPAGQYFVFVGRKEAPASLFVLDTEKDKINVLGPAPAPPPLSPESSGNEEGVRWGWNQPEAGFLPLEPGIIGFEGDHILKISYGEDTWRKRAKERRIRMWDLSR